MHHASEPALVDGRVLAELRAFRVPGEPDPAQVVVETFLDVTPPRLASLRHAVDVGDATQVRALAHVVRGSSGAVGAIAMHTLAAEIEASGSSHELTVLVARLEELFTR